MIAKLALLLSLASLIQACGSNVKADTNYMSCNLVGNSLNVGMTKCIDGDNICYIYNENSISCVKK